MTYTPDTIKQLRQYLIEKTGRDGAYFSVARSPNSGRQFEGYHLGRDQIFSQYGRGNRDYSIQTARDKAGLSDARSALDINLGDRREQELFRHLVAECQRNAPGTKYIRELIGTKDGRAVHRYDRQRGITSGALADGLADSSHLWHIHTSWYRDGEKVDKIGPFEGFFGSRAPAPAPIPEPSEDDVNLLELFRTVGFQGSIPANTPVFNPADPTQKTTVAATDRALLIGPVADGRHYALLATLNDIPGPNPKVVYLDGRYVSGAPSVDAEALAQLQAQLVAAEKNVKANAAALVASRADAGQIVTLAQRITNR